MLSLRINEFLIGFMVLSMDASAAILLLVADAEINASDVQIWGSSRLLGLSVIGSSIGAMLSISVGRKTSAIADSTRSIAASFICSMGCGVAFAPMVLEWSGIGKREDAIIPFSAVCAFVAVRIAQAAMPLLEAAAAKRIRNELGLNESTEVKTDVPKGEK